MTASDYHDTLGWLHLRALVDPDAIEAVVSCCETLLDTPDGERHHRD